MKKLKGEVTMAMVILAILGCTTAAWLEYFGMPLPKPPQMEQQK